MVSEAFLLDPFGPQVYVFLKYSYLTPRSGQSGLPWSTMLKCDMSIPSKTWIIMESALREQVGNLPKNQGINTR